MPLLLGIRRTRIVWTVLNSIALVLVTWGWISGLRVPGPVIVLPATLLTLVCVWTLDSQIPRNVYNIWIDGILISARVADSLANSVALDQKPFRRPLYLTQATLI